MIPQYRPYINRPSLGKQLDAYCNSDGFFTEYKHTADFEKEICKLVNAKHCFMMPNGTISLSIALLAMGIKKDDWVLVPNITMIATANAVKLIGANPLFVDVDFRTGCLNLDEAENCINTYNVKAVIYVTLNGRRQHWERYKKFENLCAERKIALIEDNAQSLGSKSDDYVPISCPYKGIGSFSFSMPKIITTGQGGCLVTNDDDLANKIKKLKDFGRDKGGIDIHDEFGINCKFTELQAIMGKNQLSDIEWAIRRKKEIYDRYESRLDGRANISIIHREEYHTPWFVDIYVNHREDLIEYLKQNGIGTRAVYQPLTSQKVFNGFKDLGDKMEVSNYYGYYGLWLPSSLDLKDNEIDMICERILEYYGKSSSERP